MSNPIKTRDLCERCRFRDSIDNVNPRMEYINGVPTWTRYGSKCLAIGDNTPCPYFEERDEK